jgi:oligopeptide/dipeptide ABC transporter ATP-binding protein
VAAPGWTTSAVFFDYDGDGRLDLFVGNYVRYGLDTPTSGTVRVGGRTSVMFQESALFPWLTVRRNVGLALRLDGVGRAERRSRAMELLELVHLAGFADRRPHELSGGMRQRVMIAMALACEPRLLIADEPTTALDVTIQAQILDLLRTLQRETGTAIVLITHDLGVVAETADEVAVMYAGRIVERAPVRAIFERPEHPYTIGLLGSIPRLHGEQARLASIEGQVPSPLRHLPGCRFAERCPFADAKCRAEVPALLAVGEHHLAACWKAPLDADALLARSASLEPA